MFFLTLEKCSITSYTLGGDFTPVPVASPM